MGVDNQLYDRYAASWWDEDGFLHFLKTALEPTRFAYFQRVLETQRLSPAGKRILDVGCGGGILAEDWARLGWHVTGVDPSLPSLAAARHHAAADVRQGGGAPLPLGEGDVQGTRGGGGGWGRLSYLQAFGEALPFATASFDVVCCCDVLEHLDDVPAVIGEIARVLKAGGVFFYDTINRTFRSRLVAIKVLQEWRWSSFVPPRLHDWDHFLKPAELAAALRQKGLEPCAVVGMAARGNPFAMIKALRDRKQGKITYAELGRRLAVRESRDRSVSYLGYARKPGP